MSYQNYFNIDQINNFSVNIDEFSTALAGKWAKYKGNNFKLIIVRDICFINTFGDCTIEIPQHYVFKYTDDNGTTKVNEGTNTINIKGITSFFFTIK